MAGHNKWSKIKHKKAASDAQRSKIFSKYVRLITVESKKSGGDVEAPGLKSAIEQAKAVNMPNQTIDRAVEKGTGAGAEQLDSVTFEAYGPGGCALLIDAVTDNNNRTTAEIRHIFSKQGFALASPGSAAWIFTRNGAEVVPNNTIPLSDEDQDVLEKLITTLIDHDDVQDVFTNAA